jgi:proline dehydrogenase
MAKADTSAKKISLENSEVAFASRSKNDLFKMDLMFSLMNNPALNKLAISLLLTSIKLNLPIKPIVKATIFGHFCGGETLEECLKTIDNLAKFHIGTILDFSVEGEKNESGFDYVVEETIKTIQISGKRGDVPFAVFKTSGIASVEILEKAQKGKLETDLENQAFEKARKRFATICKSASDHNVRIFVDGEESWIQGIIDKWTYEEMAIYNKEKAIIFNTYQLYRSDIFGLLKKSHEKAKNECYVLGAKLVRGAYMEKEAAYALKNGLANPIQTSKENTDKDFDSAALYCAENVGSIHFCAGSHNEKSNQLLAEKMDNLRLKRDDHRIWFAQLLGMSDNISFALAKEGFNVAKYVPYGPVFSVMPYLVRRASENTSVAGQTSRELALIQKERKRRA